MGASGSKSAEQEHDFLHVELGDDMELRLAGPLAKRNRFGTLEESLCGGTCAVPIVLSCDDHPCAQPCCEPVPVASEDLPTYVPEVHGSPGPSHWRRLFKRSCTANCPPSRLPPLQLHDVARSGEVTPPESATIKASPKEAPIHPSSSSRTRPTRIRSHGADAASVEPCHGSEFEAPAEAEHAGINLAKTSHNIGPHRVSRRAYSDGAVCKSARSVRSARSARSSASASGTSWTDVDLSSHTRSLAGSPPPLASPGSPPPLVRRRYVSPPRISAKDSPIRNEKLLGLDLSRVAQEVEISPEGSSWLPRSSSRAAPSMDDSPAVLAPAEGFPQCPKSILCRDIAGGNTSAASSDRSIGFCSWEYTLSFASLASWDPAADEFPAWSPSLGNAVDDELKLALILVSPAALCFFLGAQAVRALNIAVGTLPASIAGSSSSVTSPSPDSPSGATSSDSPGLDSARDSLCSEDFYDENLDQIGRVFDVLSEVADRPFPLELLLVSTAYARLAGTGASQESSKGKVARVVNSRHLEVEALLLRYTSLSSRLTLREELERWLQTQDIGDSLSQRSRMQSSSSRSGWKAEGPDDPGFSLSFEDMAAFITTHSASTAHLKDCFDKLIAETKSSESSVPRTVVQKGLEAALAPLLSGLPAALAGNGRSATTAARRIARQAAAIALRGRQRLGYAELDQREKGSAADSSREAHRWSAIDGGHDVVDMRNFAKLYDSAASMARVCVMHLTGDVVRWRNCIAAPSPRVDLRHSLGGG